MIQFEKARVLLFEFKGDAYLYGAGVLPDVGPVVASQGSKAALVRGTFPGSDDYVRTIQRALSGAGVEPVGVLQGARPNAPREDLFRIADELRAANPEVIVSFGGGPTSGAMLGRLPPVLMIVISVLGLWFIIRGLVYLTTPDPTARFLREGFTARKLVRCCVPLFCWTYTGGSPGWR